MSYGQFKEDEYVARFFPHDFKGVAVEVGAADGVHLSNTLLFEEMGWTVLCLEPNPLYYERLRANRKLVLPYAVAAVDGASKFTAFHMGDGIYEACSALQPHQGKVEEHRGYFKETKEFVVPVRTLNTILDQVGLTQVDLLSVDVEGGEDAVMQGFDLGRWLPKVVILEQWNDAGDFCRLLLRQHGYTLMTRLGDTNDIWQRYVPS